MEKLGFWSQGYYFGQAGPIFWLAKYSEYCLGLIPKGINYKTWDDHWSCGSRLQTLKDLGYPLFLAHQFDSFWDGSLNLIKIENYEL